MEYSKKNIKDIEVSDGVFLSTDDPLFQDKLKNYPDIKSETWFQIAEIKYEESLSMAKELKKRSLNIGRMKQFSIKINDSIHYYNKAATLGHENAHLRIQQANKLKKHLISHFKKKNKEKDLFLKKTLLLFIFLLIAFLFSLPLFETGESTEKNLNKDFWLHLYTFHTEEPPHDDNAEETPSFIMENDTFANLSIIRSAIYHYVQKEGEFPSNLKELTKSFPNNYISSIPPSFLSDNRISNTLDMKGGWYYEKPTSILFDSDKDLHKLIEQALRPNSLFSCSFDCSFKPIEIEINKNKKELILHSGNHIFQIHPIGIGKNDSTPEGLYFIQKRVAFPNYHLKDSSHPYGTRGMELSDDKYAIHGTFIDSSIGQESSAGCIRLSNKQMEWLFSFAPLYTNVNIINDSSESSVTFAKNKTNQLNTSNPPPHSTAQKRPSTETPPSSHAEGRKAPGNPNNGPTQKTPSLNKETDSKTSYNWAH